MDDPAGVYWPISCAQGDRFSENTLPLYTSKERYRRERLSKGRVWGKDRLMKRWDRRGRGRPIIYSDAQHALVPSTQPRMHTVREVTSISGEQLLSPRRNHKFSADIS